MKPGRVYATFLSPQSMTSTGGVIQVLNEQLNCCVDPLLIPRQLRKQNRNSKLS